MGNTLLSDANIKIIAKPYLDDYIENYDVETKDLDEKEIAQANPKTSEFKTNFEKDFGYKLKLLHFKLLESNQEKTELAEEVFSKIVADLKEGPKKDRSKISISKNGTINFKKSLLEKAKTEVKRRENIEIKNKESATKKENKTKKVVDFSNPEEKKKFYKNFYKGWKDCKTEEDKRKYIEQQYDVKLDNLTEEQQKKVVKINDIEAFRRERYKIVKEEVQNDPKLKNELEEVQKKIIEERVNEDTKKEFDFSDEGFEKYQKEQKGIQELLEKRQNGEITQEQFEKEINEKYPDKAEEIELKRKEDEEEKEVNNKKNEKSTENEADLSDDEELMEEDEELASLFGMDELEEDNELVQEDIQEKTQEEIQDDIKEKIEKEPEDLQESDNDQIASEQNTVDVITDDSLNMEDFASIVENAELPKKEDYTMEVDENKGLWNKIKNRFSKMKNAIVKRFGSNKNKGLKGQELIDTAENNTPSRDDEIVSNNFLTKQKPEISYEAQAEFAKEQIKKIERHSKQDEVVKESDEEQLQI